MDKERTELAREQLKLKRFYQLPQFVQEVLLDNRRDAEEELLMTARDGFVGVFDSLRDFIETYDHGEYVDGDGNRISKDEWYEEELDKLESDSTNEEESDVYFDFAQVDGRYWVFCWS